jgi:hypothetical protein
MTYYEMYWMFQLNVLVSKLYRNNNIQGTLFTKDVEKYIPDLGELL